MGWISGGSRSGPQRNSRKVTKKPGAMLRAFRNSTATSGYSSGAGGSTACRNRRTVPARNNSAVPVIAVARPVIAVRTGGGAGRDRACGEAECQSRPDAAVSCLSRSRRCYRGRANHSDGRQNSRVFNSKVFFMATSSHRTGGDNASASGQLPGNPGTARLKKRNVSGTNPALEGWLFKCSNLERGESMKDPVDVFGCRRGFHFQGALAALAAKRQTGPTRQVNPRGR